MPLIGLFGSCHPGFAFKIKSPNRDPGDERRCVLMPVWRFLIIDPRFPALIPLY